MPGSLDGYKQNIKRGVNPFQSAFPLARNERFMEATLMADPVSAETYAAVERQGLTLVHFSAQPEPFLT
jgi:hypothetical protein